VVAVDLGEMGAGQPAGHVGMPEPRGHGLVVAHRHEAGRQLAVHRTAQPDRFEYWPVRVGHPAGTLR